MGTQAVAEATSSGRAESFIERGARGRGWLRRVPKRASTLAARPALFLTATAVVIRNPLRLRTVPLDDITDVEADSGGIRIKRLSGRTIHAGRSRSGTCRSGSTAECARIMSWMRSTGDGTRTNERRRAQNHRPHERCVTADGDIVRPRLFALGPSGVGQRQIDADAAVPAASRLRLRPTEPGPVDARQTSMSLLARTVSAAMLVVILTSCGASQGPSAVTTTSGAPCPPPDAGGRAQISWVPFVRVNGLSFQATSEPQATVAESQLEKSL